MSQICHKIPHPSSPLLIIDDGNAMIKSCYLICSAFSTQTVPVNADEKTSSPVYKEKCSAK